LLDDKTVLRVSSMMRIVLDNTDNTVRVSMQPDPSTQLGNRKAATILDPTHGQGASPPRRGSNDRGGECTSENSTRSSHSSHSTHSTHSTHSSHSTYIAHVAHSHRHNARHTLPKSLLHGA
jgi:hypothetical protein